MFSLQAAAPGTLLVRCPSGACFLINCAPGTSRVSREHQLGANRRLAAVIATRIRWDRLGGLCDFFYDVPEYQGTAGLTTTTVQSPSQPRDEDQGLWKLCGPPGLKNFLFSLQSTVWRPACVVEVRESVAGKGDADFLPFSIGHRAEDSVVVVPIPLDPHNSDNKDERERENSASAHTRVALDYSAWRGPAAAGHLGSRQPRDISDLSHAPACCYIVSAVQKPGRLDVAKAVALGVPKGPGLRALKEGGDVVLPSGVTVRSADVLDVSSVPPPAAFAVFDCPSEAHARALLEIARAAPTGAKFPVLSDFAGPAARSRLRFVVHLTETSVARCAAYRELCSLLEPPDDDRSDLFHLYSRVEASPESVMATADEYLLRLAQIEPSLVCGSGRRRDQAPTGSASAGNLGQLDKVDMPSEAGARVKTDFTEGRAIGSPPPGGDEEVIFLGTSGSASTVVRGESAILVATGSGYVLMDCGEGTLLQIVRSMGVDGAENVLRNLKGILVTHKHPDHLRGEPPSPPQCLRSHVSAQLTSFVAHTRNLGNFDRATRCVEANNRPRLGRAKCSRV
jgi:hypothetical protein